MPRLPRGSGFDTTTGTRGRSTCRRRWAPEARCQGRPAPGWGPWGRPRAPARSEPGPSRGCRSHQLPELVGIVRESMAGRFGGRGEQLVQALRLERAGHAESQGVGRQSPETRAESSTSLPAGFPTRRGGRRRSGSRNRAGPGTFRRRPEAFRRIAPGKPPAGPAGRCRALNPQYRRGPGPSGRRGPVARPARRRPACAASSNAVPQLCGRRAGSPRRPPSWPGP